MTADLVVLTMTRQWSGPGGGVKRICQFDSVGMTVDTPLPPH